MDNIQLEWRLAWPKNSPTNHVDWSCMPCYSWKKNQPNVACIASVSVRFRSKERGTRVKDHAKNGASKRARCGGEERKETLADKSLDFENRPLGLSYLSSRTDI